MKPQKAPAFQFYARDWLVDTIHLSLAEQGAYIRLLSHEWVEGPLPNNAQEVARRVGVPVDEFTHLWVKLERFFPLTNGLLANPRLEELRTTTEAYHKQRRHAGHLGAKARWDNKLIAVASPRHVTASATAKKKELTPPTATWLTPFLDCWVSECGGVAPSPGRMGKALSPLCKIHGPTPVVDRLRFYLQQSNGKSSPEHFAQTYGKWTPDGQKPTTGKPDPFPLAEYRESIL